MRLNVSVVLVLTTYLLLVPAIMLAQKSQYTRKLTEETRLGLSPEKAISQYQCDIWKKNDGLPQNSVIVITQSSDGFIWLATSEGLARFDGIKFKTYNTTNVPQFKTSGILSIYEDTQKRLWIGTNNGGLICYQQGKFKNYSLSDGLPDNTITSVAQDAEGEIWIGTPKGLCKWMNGKFKSYSTSDGLSSKDITTLFLGKDSTLWIGTSRGISTYRKGKFEDYGRKRILFLNKYITSVAEDKQDNLWIGTQSGLVRYDKKDNTYEIYRVSDKLNDDYITKLYLDSRQSLWIGTNGGLSRITEKERKKEKFTFSHFTIREGLTSNSIADIFEDNEGSLWIGLNRGGLNRLRDGKFTNYTTQEGLTDNVVNCLYQSENQDIWMGTTSGGVSRFREGKFIQTYDKSKGLSSNYIRSIGQDAKGDLWIATYGNGINILELSKDAENPPIRKYTIEDGLAGDIVRAIFRDKSGLMWIGTKTGLSKFEDGKFSNYTHQLGLSDNSITCIQEDSKGNLWVGTEGGVSCIRADQTIIIYRQRNGLANDLVFTIYEDKAGTIWVGTKGGLSRIKEGEVVSIFAREGLANDDIHSLTEDNQGRIWFSSNNGVFWIVKKALNDFADAKQQGKKSTTLLQYTLYQEEEGMKSSDCAASAQPTVLKDQVGNLWYPTTEGVSVINPEQIKVNYITPSVVIKRLSADNQEYLYGKNIELKAGSNQIEIDFAALSFLAPNRVQYRYRLLGNSYREEWTETGNKREVYYTNLPPGNYRFEVQAANNDGIWNEKGASIEFYIAPFFYQTWIFYVLVFLTVVLTAFLIYYWRIRALEQSKKALERSVYERTQKIQTQYEEITQQAGELETINQIIQTINQEVKFEKVLHALLEQGLRLFSQSNQSFFLLREKECNTFGLVATQGYDESIFRDKRFQESLLNDYCDRGEQLAKGLYSLPTELLKGQTFAPNYAPQSSLAMQIVLDNQLEGLIFFDSLYKFQNIEQKDIDKLIRFREHAVSAFEKARILQELEEKNAQIENSFRKISDSIRYARRIQSAILPTHQEMGSYFEDFFIFSKPRDIVSGDFYWFAETVPEPIFMKASTAREGKTSIFSGFNEVKTMIAAIDCTGHGVPGAFMTVIGNDLLNTIVLEDKITRAHLILDKLDRNIKEYLKQEDGQSRDGMDMSLIVIDDNSQTLEFAGAKNPLYYIRKGELFQVKGSIYPIGGAQIKQKEFFSQTIEFEQGDVFYMFSDGVQDQFGGEQDRKFSSKRFRELLLKIHLLPLEEQRQIISDTITDWQGERRQTDDMLVIGLKF
jgi:ligand-binding sensor domain-containing protein/serine phosphatase RsbU (regulator of sigma subunit)